MRKSICFFALMMAIVCFNLTATKAMAGDKTRDNFFPVARLVTTPVLLSNDTAFSLLVEGGPRSYRFNGTLGFICDCNRFKISAEHLTQRLHYNFDSGKTHRWMHQLAIGGLYQHLFECPGWADGLQLGLSYSNAPSKGLSEIQTDVNEFNLRRIAGSWSWTAEAGFLMTPWECSKFIGSLTFDQVHYRRELQDGKRVCGVGFKFDFSQRFCRNFLFDVNFVYKQIYNNLGAALRWTKEFSCGDLDVGIFAYHVFGKRRLPCSTTAGIELGFAFGVCECNIVPISSSCDSYNCDPCAFDACDLVAWVSDPAVYMPQVLAITDQQNCFAPTLSNEPGSFETQIVSGIEPSRQIGIASWFNSGEDSELEFSAEGLPDGSFINPETGVITLVNNIPCGTVVTGNIFVIAETDCGSERGSFGYVINGPACPIIN